MGQMLASIAHTVGSAIKGTNSALGLKPPTPDAPPGGGSAPPTANPEMPTTPADLSNTPPPASPVAGLESIYDPQLLNSVALAPAPEGPAFGVNSAAQQENKYADLGVANTPKELGTVQTPDSDIVVQGDNFHPHKMSVLAQIADVFLKGALSKTNDKHNLTAAMEGFQNPNEPRARETMIDRVRQFNPEMAYKMSENLVDNQRADQSTDSMIESRGSAIVQRNLKNSQQLLEHINNSKDPEGQYAAGLPALRKGFEAAGMSLPDTYDAATMETLAMGGIPVTAQEKLAQGKTRLEQLQESIDNRKDAADRSAEQRNRSLTIRENQIKKVDEIKMRRLGLDVLKQGEAVVRDSNTGEPIGKSNGKVSVIVVNGERRMYDVSAGDNHAKRRPDWEARAAAGVK